MCLIYKNVKKKTRKKFEKLAESIFKQLIKNPEYETVEHNVQLDGADGKRQFDVIVKSENVGINILTVIECKDYNKKVPISIIDEFHSKLLDVNANKGIVISRKGFSSKAISKAKRLGITLCIADETENDNWQSIVDLPIVLEEIHLIHLNINVQVRSDSEPTIDFDSIIKINDQNLVELIKSKWKNNEFDLNFDTKEQILKFPELKKPHKIRTKNNEFFELENLEINCNTKRFYFVTSTSKLKNTQILDYIIEGKQMIFVDINSLKDSSLNLQKISKQDLKNIPSNYGQIRVLPPLDLQPSNFLARKID